MKNKNQFVLWAVFIFLISIVQSCKKNTERPSDQAAPQPSSSQPIIGFDGILATNPHVIENGYKIIIQGGHVFKAESATNRLVEDFGEVHFPKVDPALKNDMSVAGATTNFKQRKSGDYLYGSSGWLAAQEYHNVSGATINYFLATCQVPPLPEEMVGQTFGIWLGLSPQTGQYGVATTPFILQPILAYGQAPVNNGYSVFNYFIWGNGQGQQAVSNIVQVGAGTDITNIEYVIAYTAGTSNNLQFQLQVLNTANGNSPICNNLEVNFNTDQADIPNLNYADVVAEIPTGAPQINSLLEYPDEPANAPNSADAVITNISVGWGNPTGSNFVSTLPWAVLNTPLAQLGETSSVTSANNANLASPGTIDLWFGPAPAPTNVQIAVQNSSSQVTNIVFQNVSTGAQYNSPASPGNSNFPNIPAGTYNVTFNTTSGNQSQQILPTNNQGGGASNLSNNSPNVTIPNVVMNVGGYIIYLTNYGD
jgi:hypothetical protein